MQEVNAKIKIRTITTTLKHDVKDSQYRAPYAHFSKETNYNLTLNHCLSSLSNEMGMLRAILPGIHNAASRSVVKLFKLILQQTCFQPSTTTGTYHQNCIILECHNPMSSKFQGRV